MKKVELMGIEVSMSDLAEWYKIDPRTVKRRLKKAGVQPVGIRRGHNVYDSVYAIDILSDGEAARAYYKEGIARLQAELELYQVGLDFWASPSDKVGKVAR